MNDIGDVIAQAVKSNHYRRAPLEVTSDRIAEHIERYYDRLSGADRDALSHARDILEALLDKGLSA